MELENCIGILCKHYAVFSNKGKKKNIEGYLIPQGKLKDRATNKSPR